MGAAEVVEVPAPMLPVLGVPVEDMPSRKIVSVKRSFQKDKRTKRDLTVARKHQKGSSTGRHAESTYPQWPMTIRSLMAK